MTHANIETWRNSIYFALVVKAVRFFFAADCGEGKDQRRQDILDEASADVNLGPLELACF